jgi:hypothetical protein
LSAFVVHVAVNGAGKLLPTAGNDRAGHATVARAFDGLPDDSEVGTHENPSRLLFGPTVPSRPRARTKTTYFTPA